MKEGTAIGVLVGGAVLLLAMRSAPRAPGAPAAAPGGIINPRNWISAPTPAGGQAPSQAMPANYQQASSPYYAPSQGGGGVQNAAYNPATQNFGFTPAPSAMAGPGGTSPYGAGGFQNAAYNYGTSLAPVTVTPSIFGGGGSAGGSNSAMWA